MKKMFLMLIVLFVLFSCSSKATDLLKVYDAYKCSRVASKLGHDKQAERAMKSVYPELVRLEEEGIGGTFLDRTLADMLREESYSLIPKIVYESPRCQAMYK